MGTRSFHWLIILQGANHPDLESCMYENDMKTEKRHDSIIDEII